MWRITVALVFIAGCAPLAGLRPAGTPLGKRTYEVGGGAAFVGPRPFVQEEWRGAGQGWLSGRVNEWLTLSVIGAFDTEAAALGAAARADLWRKDYLVTGVEVEVGWLWGSLSLPLAVQAVDNLWFYTAPGLSNWGEDLLVSIPLGASIPLADRFDLRVEGRVSWADLESFNRRFHLALAGAYRW